MSEGFMEQVLHPQDKIQQLKLRKRAIEIENRMGAGKSCPNASLGQGTSINYGPNKDSNQQELLMK